MIKEAKHLKEKKTLSALLRIGFLLQVYPTKLAIMLGKLLYLTITYLLITKLNKVKVN